MVQNSLADQGKKRSILEKQFQSKTHHRTRNQRFLLPFCLFCFCLFFHFAFVLLVVAFHLRFAFEHFAVLPRFARLHACVDFFFVMLQIYGISLHCSCLFGGGFGRTDF